MDVPGRNEVLEAVQSERTQDRDAAALARDRGRLGHGQLPVERRRDRSTPCTRPGGSRRRRSRALTAVQYPVENRLHGMSRYETDDAAGVQCAATVARS